MYIYVCIYIMGMFHKSGGRLVSSHIFVFGYVYSK